MIFAPRGWDQGLRVFRSEHGVCSPATSPLSQESISEEYKDAVVSLLQDIFCVLALCRW